MNDTMIPMHQARLARGRATWPRSCGMAAALVGAFVTLLAPPAKAQRQTLQTEERTSDLDYLMLLPPEHDPAKRWPLLVFLHGYGERRTNDREGRPFSALTVHSIPRVVDRPGWDWPFIVVSPQINEEGWAARAEDLGRVVDRMEEEFGADPNRMYLTGLSYGGRGTWDIGLAQIDRWAALMPLCSDPSGLQQADREVLATKPLFVVHGTEDPTDNDFATMEAFIRSFEDEGTPFFNFDYTIADIDADAFPLGVFDERHVFARMIDYGHDVWTPTYGRVNGPAKTVPYDWLLAQSLDGSEFVDPRDPNYVLPVDDEASDEGGCSVAGAPRGGRHSAPGLLGLALTLGIVVRRRFV